MAYKSFDISKIRKTDNPFSNTRASSIEDGIFIRGAEIEDNIFIPSTKKAVKIGLINDVEKIYNDIIESSKPRHVLILADYGQGKSFSIKYIQDKIYELHADPIISYSIGINY